MLRKASIKKEYIKPSNILIKWIISYISILIIPLLICSIYYSHSYKIIKKETMERQHLTLNNVKNQLDNNLDDLLQISTNLQMNQQVVSFSYKKASSPVIHEQSKNLIDELSIFMLANSFIKEIYIYFPKSDYIITSSTIYKSSMSDFMPKRYISQDTWQYLDNNLYNNSNHLFIADHDLKLLLARSLITNNKSNNPLSLIVFEIDKNHLNSFLESQLITCHFSAFAITKKDEFLLTTNPDIAKQPKALDMLHSNEYSSNIHSPVTLSINDKPDVKYRIDSASINLYDLNLLSFTEESIYNNESSNILIVLFISLFISILIGSIITGFYSIHNYRPIKEIMGYLKAYSTDTEEKNEYNKIKEIIKKNNSEIKTQRDLLKNNYLCKLLSGELQLSEVPPSVAHQFELNFLSDFSYIVLIRSSIFKIYDKNLSPKEMSDSEKNLAFFIAQNILLEIFQPVFPNIQFCYNQAETAIILNIPNNTDPKESILIDGLHTFITYCRNYFDFNFFIGISELCDNNHIYNAYTQASNALEYMHLMGVGNLILYRDTPKESQIGYLHLHTSDYIINLVMSIGEQALDEYFNNIHQELKQTNLSTEDAKSCLYFFYNVTMRLKAQVQYQYPYSSTEDIFKLNNQFFNYSLIEAIYYIEKLYQQAIQMMKEQNLNSGDNKIYDVTQYIESNYFDSNLNLNSISAHFNITPSYLSQKFRQKTGQSIIDYLYKIRITHSIKLINDTSLKINEIAQMVGFLDSNAFIRIFKKYKGCTPGIYKSSASKLSDSQENKEHDLSDSIADELLL